MTDHTRTPDTDRQTELRRRAEERLRTTPDEIATMSTKDIQQLVHELQVHQIELEMSNDELARAHEETLRARDRYAALYELAPVGYLTLDESLNILEVNRGAASLLDVSRHELRGSRLSRFAVAQDQDACFLCLREVAAGKRSRTAEIRFCGGREEPVVVRLYATHTHSTETGRPELLVALADITEERRSQEALHASEKRYRFLYEQSQLTHVVLTLDGIITDINELALRRLGYDKQEVLGQPLTNFIVPEQRRQMEQWVDTIGRGDRAESLDVRVYAKDGSTRTFMTASQSEILYEGDNAVGLLCSATDITHRKQLEQALEQRARDLEALNKELEAFGHSVSHDLRNPLNNILAMADLLVAFYTDKLDKDGVRCVQEIATNSRRMDSTITDLLRLSRITRTEPARVPVDLSDMARGIVEELRAGRPDKAVRVIIRDSMVATVDKGLMYNALYNLIENAWKYSSHRDEPVIELGMLEQQGRTVYYVRDNGEGFDPEQAPKLFRPFHRASNHQRHEGTGIGLSLVQRIITRHGGRIWAEGKKGEGATFYFTLL
jgi:PAS domain S-box-containing protein